MDTIAFIPARGGSKSIPGKNIKPIAGKPLVHWAIEAAVGSAKIYSVYVSSDDHHIREVAKQNRSEKLWVIDRHEETATDAATTESALLEFAKDHMFDRVVLLQATNPFVKSSDLTLALELMDRTCCDSVVSVTREHKFIWSVWGASAKPVNYDPQHRKRRQEWDGIYFENGSFYITTRKALLKSGCRISGDVRLFEMDKMSNLELDTPEDWEIAEKLLIK
jgi:CMP-N-acetylneuraminic acid synthetase